MLPLRARIQPALLLLVGALGLFLFVIVRKAWVSDDAYITFRSIDNFLHGYGLRWNVEERVQPYTHPLWMLLLSGLCALTHDYSYTSIGLGFTLSLLALLVVTFRMARSRAVAFLCVVLLVFSKAFTDYSTSGLENPLTHLLLALFFWIYFEREPGFRRLVALFGVAALALTNRMDVAVLLAPPLVHAFLRGFRPQAFLAVAIGMVPFALWETFSLFYYGFPFPNSAYAKLNTGIAASALARQGIHYALNSLRWDSLTLPVAVVGVVAALRRRDLQTAAVAAGIVLHLAYVIRVGGDFMSGRFFTPAFFTAVLLIARSRIAGRLAWAISFALVLVASLSPQSPFRRPAPGDWIDDYAIADERQVYFGTTSHDRAVGQGVEQLREALDLEKNWEKDEYLVSLGRVRIVSPEEPWTTSGSESSPSRPVVVRGAVGRLSFCLGPGMHVLDIHALADPLLARLPAVQRDPLTEEWLRGRVAKTGWRIGHFVRLVPLGYLATLRTGQNVIRDADLAAYYDQLALVTRGPLFDGKRLAAIWYLNTGRYDALVRRGGEKLQERNLRYQNGS